MTAVCRAMHTFTHTHRYTHAYSHSLSHSGTQSGIHSMLVYSPTAARSSIVIHFNLPSGFPFVSFSLVRSRLCPLPLLLPLSLFLPPYPSSSRSCCQLTAMTISVPDSLRGSDLPKNIKKKLTLFQGVSNRRKYLIPCYLLRNTGPSLIDLGFV